MRMIQACLMVTVAIVQAACLRSTEYRCTASAECGTGGTCEAVGYCSFVDDKCGGNRFADSAGAYANQCVGSAAPDGGMIDAPMTMIDAPMGACPAGYAPLAGAQSTHRYRLLTAAGNWGTQQTACVQAMTTTYLAIPDDLAELQALATLANRDRFWVGITDTATENTWLTVKNVAATYLPWVANAPDNNGPGPGADCVEIVRATSQIDDERCNTQYVAVCECEL